MMIARASFVLFNLACLFAGAKSQKSSHLERRIMGGRDADISEVPYQLSLEYGGVHRCGASIISATWVLTAAHCIYGKYSKNIRFRAGSSKRGIGGSLHEAKKIISHPKFNYSSVDFDVAVIQVSPPFVMSSNVQPISLGSLEPSAGTAARVSGWGFSSFNTLSHYRHLQFVVVPVIDHDECNTEYREYGGITENMICAGPETGGKDACTRDSGGPLVTEGKLSGIVAAAIHRSDPRYPALYTNVARFRSFITLNTDAN